jgi:hypothetical protein
MENRQDEYEWWDEIEKKLHFETSCQGIEKEDEDDCMVFERL